jgi:hypothetical protein
MRPQIKVVAPPFKDRQSHGDSADHRFLHHRVDVLVQLFIEGLAGLSERIVLERGYALGFRFAHAMRIARGVSVRKAMDGARLGA